MRWPTFFFHLLKCFCCDVLQHFVYRWEPKLRHFLLQLLREPNSVPSEPGSNVVLLSGGPQLISLRLLSEQSHSFLLQNSILILFREAAWSHRQGIRRSGLCSLPCHVITGKTCKCSVLSFFFFFNHLPHAGNDHYLLPQSALWSVNDKP